MEEATARMRGGKKPDLVVFDWMLPRDGQHREAIKGEVKYGAVKICAHHAPDGKGKGAWTRR